MVSYLYQTEAQLLAAIGDALGEDTPVSERSQTIAAMLAKIANLMGAGTNRTLIDRVSESLCVDDYGVATDPDDTNAINRAHEAAAEEGKWVRFLAREYTYTGEFEVGGDYTSWRGEPGRTILKRGDQETAGAGLSFTAEEVELDGIIFDFDKASFPGVDRWGVLLNDTVLRASIRNCKFLNAGGSGIGYGLFISGNGEAAGTFQEGHYHIEGCAFANCEKSGLWIEDADRVTISNCLAYDNGGAGIRVDVQDSSLLRSARRVTISDNHCWGNNNGIEVGNFNKNNVQSPASSVLWDNGHADILGCIVSNNHCFDNTTYGLVICNDFVQVIGCQSTGNTFAAMLFSGRDGDVIGGYYASAGSWCVDMGGSLRSTIRGAKIRGGGIGVNLGATQYCQVNDCDIAGFTSYGVLINGVDTDSLGVAFQQFGAYNAVRNCRIYLTTGIVGVKVDDGITGVEVENNKFFVTDGSSVSTAAANAIQILAPTAVTQGNTFNGDRFQIVAPSGGAITYADLFDELQISTTSGTITGIRGSTNNSWNQKVAFCTLTAPGSGYPPGANAVSFSGGGGSNAAATAYADQAGKIIGIRMTNYGSGYSSAPTVAIGGSPDLGATATATVGIRVQNARRIKIYCTNSQIFNRGAYPAVGGTPATHIVVPAGGMLELVAYSALWNAQIPGMAPSTYVTGTPEGSLSAAVGTIAVRTDGGASTTLYVKESGTGSSGWVAK